jgi:hypothetical protein
VFNCIDHEPFNEMSSKDSPAINNMESVAIVVHVQISSLGKIKFLGEGEK